MKEQRDRLGVQRRGAMVSLGRALEEQAPARVDPLQREHCALAAQAIFGG
jgi:hypothetical protein